MLKIGVVAGVLMACSISARAEERKFVITYGTQACRNVGGGFTCRWTAPPVSEEFQVDVKPYVAGNQFKIHADGLSHAMDFQVMVAVCRKEENSSCPAATVGDEYLAVHAFTYEAPISASLGEISFEGGDLSDIGILRLKSALFPVGSVAGEGYFVSAHVEQALN